MQYIHPLGTSEILATCCVVIFDEHGWRRQQIQATYSGVAIIMVETITGRACAVGAYIYMNNAYVVDMYVVFGV